MSRGASFAVPGPLAGERIDRAVALLTSSSRSEAARLVAAGGVRLGGRVVTSGSQRLVVGDELEIDAVEVDSVVDLRPAVASSESVQVVHADGDLIVVDKPPGVVVHPGAGHHEGTLVSQLIFAFPDLATTPRLGDPTRPGIVHRLDKDTSGLLAVARSARAYESLVSQLANRTMGRRYRALVLGHLESSHGLVDAPIGRSRGDPTKMAVTSGGREARTWYQVVSRFDSPVPASELIIRLETGRTHQIRVHLAAIGHPVAGDRRYGGARRLAGLERPFLHAERLELVHPASEAVVVYEASLAADLAAALQRYR